jgi:hypothetical protein
MGFDLVSGFLTIAGVFLGLLLLFGCLLANRGMDVTCILHDESAKRHM